MTDLTHHQYPLIAPAEARGELANYQLHGEAVELSLDDGLYDLREIGLPRFMHGGERLDVVAEAALEGDEGTAGEFAFVRTRTELGDQLFAVGLMTDETGKPRATGVFIALQLGVPLSFGRSRDANIRGVQGSEFGPGVSRNHLTATWTGQVLKLEDTSTNGSFYKGNTLAGHDAYEYEASHTVSAEEGARLRGMLREESTMGVREFGGRPTIGRDTFPIDGHVDIRSWVAGGEAIVVDSKKYPQEFDKLRACFLSKLHEQQDRKQRHPSEASIIKAIYAAVDETMEYDLAFVDVESEAIKAEVPDHRKASLTNYFAAGKGVCRHMALAVSWLGGEAHRAGLLGGRFTTEVNQSTQGNGAHEWSRYTSPSGEVVIIDVAQHFVGPLAKTLYKKPSGGERWGYFRSSEERDAYRRAKHGGAIVNLGVAQPTPMRGNRIITSEDVPK
ncbi:MAG: hypothetical protein WAQ57_03265 [Candidatus Saccharimonadales bacterium]